MMGNSLLDEGQRERLLVSMEKNRLVSGFFETDVTHVVDLVVCLS